MKLKRGLYSVCELLKIRFMRKRNPLVVRWDITARCPLRCKYCNIWNMEMRELSTDRICTIIDEMAQTGVQKISFSGGEPLMRADIGEIIHYTKAKGISPEMNSSGFMFCDKVDTLKDLDLVKFSIDGPPEIHDLVRGKQGSHQWIIDALQCAKQHKIKFDLCVTLTGYNINHIEYLLKLASDWQVHIRFQSLKNISYLKHAPSVMAQDEKLIPAEGEFKKAVDLLMRYQKQGSVVSNSQRSLRHIYNWPHYPPLACWGGKIFCMISPAGEVSPCDRLSYGTPLPNCQHMSFQEAIRNLPPLPYCEGCGFLGSLGINYFMNGKFDWRLLRNLTEKTV